MMAQVKFDITFGRLVVGRSPPPRPLHMVVTGGNRIGTLALICDSSPHPTEAMPPVSNEQQLRPNRPLGSGCHQWEWRETLHRPTCERIEVRYQRRPDGRGGGTRTHDLVLPKHVPYQLGHTPTSLSVNKTGYSMTLASRLGLQRSHCVVHFCDSRLPAST